MSVELKVAGAGLKPIGKPVLKLTVGLDGADTPTQLAIGDPEHRVTRAEAWMIEVVMVGIEVLQSALTRLTSALVAQEVKNGQETRAKQKEMKTIWNVTEGKEN